MATPAVLQRPRFLAPGDKLGKYDLIRQIAIGGMAELYLARTVGIEGFEKLVVLKRILPQYMANQQFVGMFLNEARLAATLQHPNIAQVYDIGVEEGDYFFAMEYIHGEDLGHLNATALEHGVPMSLDASLTLVAGLCAGLHYAHEKTDGDGKPLGVVHRDVSPSNVLVSYDGAVKLVDFGIARASSHNTTQGGLKGKIVYMSPEQCRGNAKLDRRSDVFSAGALLFELTTGRTPFVAETEYGILNQIVNQDAPLPSTLVPDFPPALEKIVMKSLARDPDARYPSALALQGAVEDFAHENRLRVSPLVLARLMSSLFPARLEEWEHARKQGAFFVEQHVLQTLIQQKTELGERPPFEPDVEPTGVDTEIRDMPSADEPTSLRGRPVGPPAPDESVPISAPHAGSPFSAAGMHAAQQGAAVPTHVDAPSFNPAPYVPPPRMPTPLPTQRAISHPQNRLPTPVPGMPNAVPILAYPLHAPEPESVPQPANPTNDRTLSVRVPTPAPHRSGSRRGAVIAAVAGITIAAGTIAFIVMRGGGEPTGSEAAGDTLPSKRADDDVKPDKPTDVKKTDPAIGSTDSKATETDGAKTNDATDGAKTTGSTNDATDGAKAGSTNDATDSAKTVDAEKTSTTKTTTKSRTGRTHHDDAKTSTTAGKTSTTTAKIDTGKTATTKTDAGTTTTKTDAGKTTTKTDAGKTATTDTKSKTTDKKGSAWSSDSPFMPVRVEKH